MAILSVRNKWNVVYVKICKKDDAWNPSACACECDKDCENEEYFKKLH